MSSTDVRTDESSADSSPPGITGGPLARFGARMAGNFKWVVTAWLVVIIGLGAFAPSVFGSLAGAGWQSNGSESVQVRELARSISVGTPRPRYRWSCTRTPSR